MKKEKNDRFYTIYALIVTIAILGFTWVVFESEIIYGAENYFTSQNQIQIMAPDDSLSDTAQKIIDEIEKNNQFQLQFENIKIEEI